MERRAKVYRFQARDIERLCTTLNCTRAQLAGRLGVSRACVSRWERGLRAPHGGDAARLRALVGEPGRSAVDVFDLRAKRGMTQRVFGAQFGVSRQQVQKWESGAAVPHRSQLQKLVTLAAAATGSALQISHPEMLRVSGAAKHSAITENTQSA